MEIKKVFLEGKLQDVVDSNEFIRRTKFKDSEILKDTCIDIDGGLYPVASYDPKKETPYAKVVGYGFRLMNTDQVSDEYKSDDKVVDLSNISSSSELLERQNKLREEEMFMLKAKQNKVFAAAIREGDSPSLILVKECLNKKGIDIDNYRGRFDSNCDFSNTVRLLVNENNHTLSFQKMQLIGEKFDIDFKITAYDKKDAINPMQETFEREL